MDDPSSTVLPTWVMGQEIEHVNIDPDVAVSL